MMKCYGCGVYAIPQEPLAALIWAAAKGRLPWLLAYSGWADLLWSLRMTRSVALVLFLTYGFLLLKPDRANGDRCAYTDC